jgi:hypothetical protein
MTNTKEKTLREERFILTHGFRDFNPFSWLFFVSVLVVRQSIMAEGCMYGNKGDRTVH